VPQHQATSKQTPLWTGNAEAFQWAPHLSEVADVCCSQQKELLPFQTADCFLLMAETAQMPEQSAE